MKKSHESVTRPVAAVVPPVTPSTMPAMFRVSSDHVHVPTLAERTRRAHDLVTLAQAALVYDHLSGVEGVTDEVREFTGYLPEANHARVAAGRALSQALEELHWLLHHPDPAVLALRVPTQDDWESFEEEQQKVAAGGAR